jgi:putative transposase
LLLGCHVLSSTSVAAGTLVFTRLFQVCGLPKRIRTDNGVPFATNTLARRSPLSAWWVRLGSLPDGIEPGTPQQNGRHERLHHTLQAETTRPRARPRRAQQLKVDRLREECNRQRPHAALDRHTSASRNAPSPLEMPHRRPPLEYPDRFEVRDVSANGGIRWNRQGVQVSIPGAGAEVGLDKIDAGVWNVYCSPLKRDRLLERHLRIEDAYGRLQQHRQPMSPDFFVTYLPGWSFVLVPTISGWKKRPSSLLIQLYPASPINSIKRSADTA